MRRAFVLPLLALAAGLATAACDGRDGGRCGTRNRVADDDDDGPPAVVADGGADSSSEGGRTLADAQVGEPDASQDPGDAADEGEDP
ncbi:MAG: hypothetical protein KF819_30205 [Labilithrix sp.]|nr:hypothetical protein [Labilithrix sp.]